MYCSAVKSGREARGLDVEGVGVDGGRIKSGRNDVGGRGEGRWLRREAARNKVQERSAATFWR